MSEDAGFWLGYGTMAAIFAVWNIGVYGIQKYREYRKGEQNLRREYESAFGHTPPQHLSSPEIRTVLAYHRGF